MNKFLFSILFLFLSVCNGAQAQAHKNCKVTQLVEAIKDNSNNVELSEYRNELLFEIVGSKCVTKLVKAIANDTILQNKICAELESPVSDAINLRQVQSNLSSVPSDYKAITEKMNKAINTAIDKYKH